MRLNKDAFKKSLSAHKRERYDLRLGDCAEVLKGIPSASIDLVVTSPPYDGLRDYKGYVFDFESIAVELARVIRPGGVIVWVVGDASYDGSETGTSFKQALFFKDTCGLNLHDTMIYQKTGIKFPDVNRYWANFEYMFVFSKGSPVVFNPICDRENKYIGSEYHGTERTIEGSTKPVHAVRKGISRPVPEFSRRYNIWRMHNAERGVWSQHPATFPYQLAHDHIVSWSNKNQVVLDPFMGSGTTGEAAYDLERYFIGIEISEEYFKLAEQRILAIPKKAKG